VLAKLSSMHSRLDCGHREAGKIMLKDICLDAFAFDRMNYRQHVMAEYHPVV